MQRLPLAFSVLGEGDIARIQEATERLLEETGFRVTHAGLRARARAAGARVDDAAERVRLPRTLLRELLAQAPSSFEVAWQDG
ncbi:MAG TPA: trimethylamine methyltransferase family protein, partial [Candidatus Hydrogenedentes bacterium]|nr:trimethylamine methyltransferase family protein [Candidatus Hydrogenedentota bacterium]